MIEFQVGDLVKITQDNYDMAYEESYSSIVNFDPNKLYEIEEVHNKSRTTCTIKGGNMFNVKYLLPTTKLKLNRSIQ
jgi:hypothetical protein